jgi:hypothetical protein
MPDRDTVLRNHVVATPRLVVRGNVDRLTTRLTEHLRAETRPFLRLVDVDAHFLPGDATTRPDDIVVLKSDVAWAHEFIAFAGDDHQRRLHVQEDEIEVHVWFARPEGLLLRGIITEAAWAAMPDWIVVRAPQPTAFTPVAEHHAEAMKGLGWILCHLRAVSAVAPVRPDDRDAPMNEHPHG